MKKMKMERLTKLFWVLKLLDRAFSGQDSSSCIHFAANDAIPFIFMAEKLHCAYKPPLSWWNVSWFRNGVNVNSAAVSPDVLVSLRYVHLECIVWNKRPKNVNIISI